MYLEYHHLIHWKHIKWHFVSLLLLFGYKMSREKSPCAKDLVPSYRHCWEMTGQERDSLFTDWLLTKFLYEDGTWLEGIGYWTRVLKCISPSLSLYFLAIRKWATSQSHTLAQRCSVSPETGSRARIRWMRTSGTMSQHKTVLLYLVNLRKCTFIYGSLEDSFSTQFCLSTTGFELRPQFCQPAPLPAKPFTTS